MKEIRVTKYGLSLWIYSEDRYTNFPAMLYKHFVEVRIFGILVFKAVWKTGKYCDGQIANGNIIVNGRCIENQ